MTTSPIESKFLSPQDIKDLTNCTKVPDQVKTLEEPRIPHKVVGKRLIVSRHQVRKWLARRRLVLPRLGGPGVGSGRSEW